MIPRDQLLPTARDVFRSHPIEEGAMISEGYPLTHQWFSDCFQLFIHVEQDEIANEENVAPNASKLHGRPFLPPGLEWPDGYYLEVQLDLGELARHDPYGVIPGRGMLYLFFDPSRKDFLPASPTACRALVHDSEPTNTSLRGFPDRSRLPPGYHDAFGKRAYLLRFETAFSFTNHDTIPPGLIATLEARLGIRHVEQSTTNLFGPPIFWQGEDEISMFDPEWTGRARSPSIDPERVLFFQRDLADGQLHFWGRRDQIKRGDFSGLEATTSVT